MAESIRVGLVCPKCGQELLAPVGKGELQLSDTVRCPIHGDVGRLEELTNEVCHNVATDAFEKMFKDSGVKFTKESK